MHADDTLAAEHNESDAIEVIQRMDLLQRQFSKAEIEHLSNLQVRCRERHDALDLPLEVCRLRFVRWLVEHGKISEDNPSHGESELEEKYPQTSRRKEDDVTLPGNAPPSDLDSEPGQEGILRTRCDNLRLTVRRTISRVWRGINKAFSVSLEPEGLAYSSYQGMLWRPYEGVHTFEADLAWFRLVRGW